MIAQIFLDTNCLIHLRDIKDLPWKNIFLNIKGVEINICQAVIDELDEIKNSRSGRVRDRSRMALSLIEEASAIDGMTLLLRSEPYPVSLKIIQRTRINWAQFPTLDPMRIDDVLVAEIISSDNTEAILVSSDAGPLIRARSMGLKAIRSPEDWALQPVRDEAEQKIAKLQKELELARSTRPNIEVQFLGQDDGKILCKIPVLEPLSDSVIHNLLKRKKELYPIKNIRITDYGPFGGGLMGVTSYMASEYCRSYESFIERNKDQLKNLHKALRIAMRWGEIVFEYKNNSNVTASNLRVEMSCATHMSMFGSRSEMESFGGAIKRVLPPREPKPTGIIGHFEPPARFDVPPRDPTGFYWIESPKGRPEGILVCDEFRSMQSRREVIYVGGPSMRGSDMQVEITATNLPGPVKIEINVCFEEISALWTDEYVLRRLPDWMADVIQNS